MISTNLPFLSTSTSLPPFGLKNHSWIFQPSDYINASFIPDQLTGYPRKYIAAQVRNVTGYPRKYIAAQVRHLGLLRVNQEKKGAKLQFPIIVRKENSQLWKIRSFPVQQRWQYVMINLALDPDVNSSRIQYIWIISQKNLKFPVDSKKRQNREKKTHRPVFPIPFQNCLTACWLAPLCYRSGLVLVPPSPTARWKYKHKHKQKQKHCNGNGLVLMPPHHESAVCSRKETQIQNTRKSPHTLHHRVFFEQQNKSASQISRRIFNIRLFREDYYTHGDDIFSRKSRIYTSITHNFSSSW